MILFSLFSNLNYESYDDDDNNCGSGGTAFK